MAYPAYIVTRAVTIGGAMGLEDATELTVKASIRASRSLVWEATGYRFERVGVSVQSDASGGELSIELPCTDVQGWRDSVLNMTIDVSAPGSYSHTYTADVTFLDAAGTPQGGTVTIGPFVIPTGTGPIDLDVTVPIGTTPGGTIPSLPDATGSAKGVLKLAGDLGGTADVPTVPGLAGKAASTDPRFTDARTPTGVAGGDLAGTYPNPAVNAASETVAGKVEIATQTEVTTGTDDVRAVTPKKLAAAGYAKTVSPAFTGSPTAPTTPTNDDSTRLATTAYVRAQGHAPLESPMFTGNPTAPTPAAGDNDTSLATTAFVTAAVTAQRGLYVGVNAQIGTTYTLVLGDQGKLVTCANASAIAVTIPANATVAFQVGAQVDVAVMGAGMITFVGASGVTVDGTPSLVTRAQYSAVTLMKVASDQWLVVGDLA